MIFSAEGFTGGPRCLGRAGRKHQGDKGGQVGEGFEQEFGDVREGRQHPGDIGRRNGKTEEERGAQNSQGLPAPEDECRQRQKTEPRNRAGKLTRIGNQDNRAPQSGEGAGEHHRDAANPPHLYPGGIRGLGMLAAGAQTQPEGRVHNHKPAGQENQQNQRGGQVNLSKNKRAQNGHLREQRNIETGQQAGNLNSAAAGNEACEVHGKGSGDHVDGGAADYLVGVQHDARKGVKKGEEGSGGDCRGQAGPDGRAPDFRVQFGNDERTGEGADDHEPFQSDVHHA